MPASVYLSVCLFVDKISCEWSLMAFSRIFGNEKRNGCFHVGDFLGSGEPLIFGRGFKQKSQYLM